MRSEKRRDWYDEIYDTYVQMHLLGDESSIAEWTPYGRNSIDITFKDGSIFRYNYFSNSIMRLNVSTADDNERLKKLAREFFPRKLIKAIGDAGHCQKDVAEETGLTECAISRYCNGDSIPNIISIMLIAKALKCELNDLIPYYDFNDNRMK